MDYISINYSPGQSFASPSPHLLQHKPHPLAGSWFIFDFFLQLGFFKRKRVKDISAPMDESVPMAATTWTPRDAWLRNEDQKNVTRSCRDSSHWLRCHCSLHEQTCSSKSCQKCVACLETATSFLTSSSEPCSKPEETLWHSLKYVAWQFKEWPWKRLKSLKRLKVQLYYKSKVLTLWINKEHGAVFIWVSKSNWFCITTLRDWLKKLAPLFMQSEVRPKPIVKRSHTFSRALSQLHVITPNFDWLTRLSVSFVIG